MRKKISVNLPHQQPKHCYVFLWQRGVKMDLALVLKWLRNSHTEYIKAWWKTERELALSLNDARVWAGRSLQNRHVDQMLYPFEKSFHHCMNGLTKMQICLFKQMCRARPQGGFEILPSPFDYSFSRTLITPIPKLAAWLLAGMQILLCPHPQAVIKSCKLPLSDALSQGSCLPGLPY